MADPMTREQALAFRARWTAVNAFQVAEAERTSLSSKLRQLDALMASVRSFGWQEALRVGEEEIRGRWTLLKRRCRD